MTQKSCEVNKFSIYTDKNTFFTSTSVRETILEQMNFDKHTTQSNTLKYILQPTSLMAEITRDMSLKPLRKRNKPRIRVCSSLKHFQVRIDEEQVKYISSIVRFVNIHSNRNIACRPLDLSLSSDTGEERRKLVKSWWFYAIQCIQMKLKKPDRKFLLGWSKDIVSYRKIYEQVLINRFNQTIYPLGGADAGSSGKACDEIQLPNEMAEEKIRIESVWSFDRLTLTRRIIFEKFVKNPIFKEYFVKLKQNNSLNQTDANSSSGMYSYVTWSLSNLKGYYYGKSI